MNKHNESKQHAPPWPISSGTKTSASFPHEFHAFREHPTNFMLSARRLCT